MDYDKLIERLNTKLQSYVSYTDSEFARAMEDAITAIETLRAESIMHHNAADNYFAEANEYREERNDALTELEQMTACIYYKPGGLCRYGGDDPANMCVLGPCPNNKSAEKVLADLARVTAERDAAIRKYEAEKEDFLDYALSGTQNAAPFCRNRHPDCVDKRGWCIPVKCRGFSRDKED